MVGHHVDLLYAGQHLVDTVCLDLAIVTDRNHQVEI